MVTFGELVFSTRAARTLSSVEADAIWISGYGVEIGGMMDWKVKSASGIHSLICFCVVMVVFLSAVGSSRLRLIFPLLDLIFPDL